MATYLPTLVTLKEARARVARVVGGQDSTTIQAEATEKIQDTLRLWMREHDWSYLITTAGAVTASADEADYVMPDDFRSIYTVRQSETPRPLLPIPQRYIDRLVWDQSPSGPPTHYTTYKLGQSNQLHLYPTPNAPLFVFVKYYRAFVVPAASATASILDVPDHWVDGVIDMARGKLLAERAGQDARAQIFGGLGREALETAKADDKDDNDDDPRFISSAEQLGQIGYPPGHLWSAIHNSYGY